MLKVALVSSLAASTAAAAVSKKESVQTHDAQHLSIQKVQEVKHFFRHHAAEVMTAKKTQGLLSASTLKARGMSKDTPATRALRGKGGKGKGKGKGDDDNEGGSDGDGTRQYFQFQSGFCAGMTGLLGETLEEDFFFSTFVGAFETCADGVLPDGTTISFNHELVSTNPVTIIEKEYMYGGCVDENLVLSEDITPYITNGGEFPIDGECHNVGFGVKLSVTDSPSTTSSAPALKRWAYTTGSCGSDFYDFDMEVTSYWIPEQTFGTDTFPAHWGTLCSDGNPDEDDDGASYGVPSTTSYQYDTSGCNGDTPTATLNMYDDVSCSVLSSSDTMASETCKFDWEHFADELGSGGDMDFLFESFTCTDGSTEA